jgi:hypothetical protein
MVARSAALVLLALVPSCAGSNEEGRAYLAKNAEDPLVTTIKSGLQYKVLQSGPADGQRSRFRDRRRRRRGPTRSHGTHAHAVGRPAVNSPCVCHYTGSLIDGTVFDSSVRRGKPATFAPVRRSRLQPRPLSTPAPQRTHHRTNSSGAGMDALVWRCASERPTAVHVARRTK